MAGDFQKPDRVHTLWREEIPEKEKEIKGKYQKVAVSCWFTSKGRSMPQLVKYEDADGEIQCIRDISMQSAEEKYFAGIRMRRYDCCAEDHGILKNFAMLYHMEEGTWDMVLKE